MRTVPSVQIFGLLIPAWRWVRERGAGFGRTAWGCVAAVSSWTDGGTVADVAAGSSGGASDDEARLSGVICSGARPVQEDRP